MDKRKLILQALLKMVAGFLLMGALLFLPAGTLDYLGAWLLLGALFFPMLIIGFVLLKVSPERLEKRLHSDEGEPVQKVVIAVSSLSFILTFVLAGLDYRHRWTVLPLPVMVVATIVFILSYGLYVEVIRENAFLSRTVEVQENQKVVDTGLYGVVRHPMYMAVTIMFTSIPFVLGSGVAILPMLGFPAILILRIKNEEKVLEEGLEGYKAYKEKVKYRMVPHIW